MFLKLSDFYYIYRQLW